MNIFLNEYESEKINLDSLYEKKEQKDLLRLKEYEKVLGRIQHRIKYTARTSKDEWCYFIMPEVVIGLPGYDVAEGLNFVMKKLNDNGFKTQYTHPNLLLISWKHWLPSHVRAQIKTQTGVNIDGNGDIIEKKKPLISNKIEKNNYKNINDYTPSGKLFLK
jgi:hypothetical protein